MIEIWTDGSGLAPNAEGTRHPIGYAFVARIADHVLEMAVYDPAGTNNTAELKAAIVALSSLNPQACLLQGLTIHSDSEYVIGQATKNWQINANAELVMSLRALSAERRTNWHHVPGHSGDWGNERADALSGWARKNGSGNEPRIMRFCWLHTSRPNEPILEKNVKETVKLCDGSDLVEVRNLT